MDTKEAKDAGYRVMEMLQFVWRGSRAFARAFYMVLSSILHLRILISGTSTMAMVMLTIRITVIRMQRLRLAANTVHSL
ncbi:hypothetical protein DL89DRAFT_265400 [Linderina pennispora]|uniref:Uncharacterized protein n=1 Tax=Linderina pennispora TaxID=61395 RepID=A0A1Y1WIU3_9FUNG|nr:uncharacterized protein DL89DRAFT_265400 [Linderina pennispora]ORX73285.1 hypothetical protein DL89DRAFT_265400 [Linderina pennispora]